MSELLTIAVATELTETEIAGVVQLVADAEAVDHMRALNEAALLRLRRPHPTTQHVLVSEDEDLVGYAQLESGTEWSGGQLVVSPEHRRQGVGTLLLQRLITGSSSPLRVWAMGDTPAARALATAAGMTRQRELLIMERRLDDELPEPVVPAGVQIRTFVPGQDEQEWLRVNAAAFAHHPEQALIDGDDLADRMAEPWFDAEGFFVATIDDTIVGFHWTKQHQDQLGEVYVLGIVPSAAGRGLGKALLLTGLRSLQQRGSTRVELYVEADHRAAIELYLSYGFATVSRDVMYAQG
ncbi:MAG TPA: mycothiol synthase [Propionibacteriaceae bacterium]|jgi:mycothiol synthase|nr:mycothiol synthase [Propionibacteriaceae bacterium]